MARKIDEELMEMGDEMFWEEFNSYGEEETRYTVVDTKGGEIIVSGARLIKEKKKIEV